MNPFNILVNYVIANSRAAFYNVPGNQEITNTALLTGMVSENPLMSYLIIDNKAKTEGERLSTTAAIPFAGTVTNPGLPSSGSTTLPAETSNGTSGTPQANENTGKPCEDQVTLEAVRNEIVANNLILKEEFAKSLESHKAELNKIIAENFETKITVLEKSNVAINASIDDIKKRLDEISNRNPAPDFFEADKNSSKGSAKTDSK